MREEYVIPKELQEMFIEIESLTAMRELFVKSALFGYRRAKKASIKLEKLRVAFWNGVHEIYPELKGKKIVYDKYAGIVTVAEELDA